MRILIVLFFILLTGTSVAQNAELANSYFVKGEYEKAISIYEPLLENNPIRQDYFKSLLTCYQQLQQYQKAYELLENQIERFPNQVYLFVEIGHNYQLQNNLELANENYDKAMSYIYKQPGYSFMVGRAFSQNHLLDRALESYQLAKKLNPKLNTEINEAQIYGEKGEFEKMFELYLDMLAKNDNYYSVVQRNIAHFIEADKNNPNNVLLKKQLLKRAQSEPRDSWNILLSWLFSQQYEYKKAFIQEKSIYKRNPDNLNRILEVGFISYENKDLETAVLAFEFVKKNIGPNYNLSNMGYQADLYLIRIRAQLLKENSDLSAIKKAYLTLIDQYGRQEETIELEFDYADFLSYRMNESDQAIIQLQDYLEFLVSDPEKASVQMKIADILVFTNQFNQALIIYTRIQNDHKNSVLAQEARFKIAQTSYFKGDFQWAQNQLKVLKSSTSQLIANDALELNLKITNNFEKDSLNQSLHDYARGEFLYFQKKNSEALDVFEDMLIQYKGQDIEDDTLFIMAKVLSDEGDYSGAEMRLLTLIDLHPNSIWTDDSIFNLAEIYQYRLNDVDAAKKMYERIIFEFPGSIHLVSSRKAYRLLRGDEL